MEKSKEKRSVFILCFAGIFLIMVFCLIQIYDYIKIDKIDLPQINDNSELNWNIDSISNGNYFVAISGWAFIPNENPQNFTINLILENPDNQEAFIIPTVLNLRKELSSMDTSDIDYSQTGFSARVIKLFLDLETYSYNIYLQYDSPKTQITILTDRSLDN